MWEDSKKDVKSDEKQLEATYQQMKQDFLRVKDLVGNMANNLDLDMPQFIIEEDKSKQTHMVISKKHARSLVTEEKASKESLPATEEAQAPRHPFNDELERKFYMVLPDLKRFCEAAQGVIDDDPHLIESAKKMEAQFEELTKKIIKSQSKD